MQPFVIRICYQSAASRGIFLLAHSKTSVMVTGGQQATCIAAVSHSHEAVYGQLTPGLRDKEAKWNKKATATGWRLGYQHQRKDQSRHLAHPRLECANVIILDEALGGLDSREVISDSWTISQDALGGSASGTCWVRSSIP